MGRFSLGKVKRCHSVTELMTKEILTEVRQYFDKCRQETCFPSKVDPERVFFLRPSSLPFCALRRFLHFAEEGVSDTNIMNADGNFYVKTGITMHTILQDTFGRGGRILGDWKCTHYRCQHILRWTTHKKCPKCGSPTRYEEAEFKYKSWRSHLDGAYRSRKKKNWLLDYKTSSTYILGDDKPAIPTVSRTYQEQSKRYVVFVEDKYGIEVEGFIIVYVSRDNPFKLYKLSPVVMSQEEKDKIRKLANKEDYLHKKMFKIKSVVGAQRLCEGKLCKNKTDHDKNFPYQSCPYVNDCFDDEKMSVTIDRIVMQSPHLPLVKYMPDNIKFQLYGDEK